MTIMIQTRDKEIIIWNPGPQNMRLVVLQNVMSLSALSRQQLFIGLSSYSVKIFHSVVASAMQVQMQVLWPRTSKSIYTLCRISPKHFGLWSQKEYFWIKFPSNFFSMVYTDFKEELTPIAILKLIGLCVYKGKCVSAGYRMFSSVM